MEQNKKEKKKARTVEVVKFIADKKGTQQKRARNRLNQVEAMYRKFPDGEILPYAKETSFVELAENVCKDPDGAYAHDFYLFQSWNDPSIGIDKLAKRALALLEQKKNEKKDGNNLYPMDILSVSAGMDGDKACVIGLIRVYLNKPSFQELHEHIGATKEDVSDRVMIGSRRAIPPGAYHEITEEERARHERALQIQNEIIENSDGEMPFLNQLDYFEPDRLYEVDPRQELTYDLRTEDMQLKTKSNYEDFINVFTEAMRYITANEKDGYYGVLRDEMQREDGHTRKSVLEFLNSADDSDKSRKKSFFTMVNSYIKSTFVDNGLLPKEDVPAILKRIDKALFQFYVLQDIIDDPLITDIKITDPWTIRVRAEGKAYRSNIAFIDREDMVRFIQGLAVMNNIDLRIPKQTFSCDVDENYKLRIALTSPMITSTGYPIMHVRKTPKVKMLADDLIEAGMMTPVIRDYIINRGKEHSFMVVGPPGSGKSRFLNWILEDAYESSAEILVIQDFDELSAYRSGVMFEQVMANPPAGQEPVTLEKLGEQALVSGCNVFIIGETRGAEICHAIKLANAGCRTAMTMHTQSSSETINNMIMRLRQGIPNIEKEQAMKMLACFDTIVYIDGFKVREILEVNGYNDEKGDMDYRPAYIAPGWERTGAFAVKKDKK